MWFIVLNLESKVIQQLNREQPSTAASDGPARTPAFLDIKSPSHRGLLEQIRDDEDQNKDAEAGPQGSCINTELLISTAFISLRSQSLIPRAFLLPLQDSCIIICRVCVAWY